VTDLFRQLVQVKGVYIIRDVTTGYSRGVGFIELFSIEHAVYVIQNASSLILDRNCLRVGFTRAAFLQQHMNPQVTVHYYVATKIILNLLLMNVGTTNGSIPPILACRISRFLWLCATVPRYDFNCPHHCYYYP
jgi:RNA recognition motif-containing protein